MMPDAPILAVVFFRTNSGREPVREWLLGLSKEDKKVIGEDIKLVQFRWPLGMPLVRKLEPDLWEIRSRLGAGRIARVFFTVHGSQIALLHGCLKKSEKTPSDDLKLARTRRDLWQKEMQ
jgi:phage-related protein